MGDFNGDGRDDIAGRTPSGGWWVARSTGSQFINGLWGNWSSRVSWDDVLVGDFNGDGRDDLAVGAPGEAPGSDPKSGYLFAFQGSISSPTAWRGLHQER